MNPVLQNVMYIVLSYILIIVIFFVTINFLSKGWLATYLRVKASRGKKVMVCVRAISDTYYRIGYFDESKFHYKTRHKTDKLLTDLDHSDIEHIMGVSHITVDEKNDTVYSRDGKTKAAISAANADQLVKRAILAALMNNKVIRILMILVVISLIVGIINLFMTYSALKILKEILPIIHSNADQLAAIVKTTTKGVVP